MRLPLPENLDADELSSWARHPATVALAKAVGTRWKLERFKTVSPENLPRHQGQQEVIDAIDEWFSLAGR